MPRNGSGAFSNVPGTTVTPNTTIQSAWANAFSADVEATFNTAWPVSLGGNGVTDNKPLANSFGIRDNTDLTKLAIFDVASIPTATTRTYTFPATSGTLALTSQITPLASKVDTRRNRVVNGDKLVSQENAQTSGTTNGRYISDQNAMYFVSSAGTFTGVNVQTLSPAGGYRDRITITTADASLAAGEYLTYTQNIEGSNIRDAKWGTAGAVPIIVRRGFKFPAGTYTVAFHNSAVNRSYVTSFVVSGGEANTDIVREFAIPGDTTGTWLSADGVIGLVMDVVIAAGTTFQTTANAWQSGNFLTIAGSTNGIGTAAAVFEFFDEGLKLDPDATGSYGVYQAGEIDPVYRSERYCELVFYPAGNGQIFLGMSAGASFSYTYFLKFRKAVIPVATVVNGAWAPGAPSVFYSGDTMQFFHASVNFALNGSAGTVAAKILARLS